MISTDCDISRWGCRFSLVETNTDLDVVLWCLAWDRWPLSIEYKSRRPKEVDENPWEGDVEMDVVLQ